MRILLSVILFLFALLFSLQMQVEYLYIKSEILQESYSRSRWRHHRS